jgi:hypothetical protein
MSGWQFSGSRQPLSPGLGLRPARSLLLPFPHHGPRFSESDTALCDSAFLQSEAKMQVVSKAKDNFSQRRRRALAVRRRRQGQRQLRLGAALHPV